MYYNHDPNFIYLSNPKTATRSIRKYCEVQFPNGTRVGGHETDEVPLGCEGYPIACTVRNPYDRACSAYWFNCHHRNDHRGYVKAFEKYNLANTLLNFL